MRATRAVLLRLAAMGVTAALMTGPGHASEPDRDSDVDHIDCEPTSAELEDIEFMAGQEGISRDEALSRYGWQECFSEVSDSLRSAYPEEYAGAAIVDDGRGAWIAFGARPPRKRSS